MKKITIIAFLQLSISLFSQPVFNSSDINPLNLSENIFAATSTNLGVGGAGANVTWNFLSLVLSPDGSSSSVSVATAPYASSFPTANFFVNGTSSNGNQTGYYNLTTSKLEVLGASNSTGIIVTFVNPQTIFQFPFLYNSSFTDTYQTNFGIPRTLVTTYDAYGTLTTAFGTYSNVIRLKREEINGGGTQYSWFKLNPYQQLLDAAISPNNSEINYTVVETTNLAIFENQPQTQFSIFPNPTSGNLTIKNPTFAENETFVNVYDVLGNEIIKNNKLDNDSKNIDMSNLSIGMYFVKITDANNAALYTEKIIKN